MPVKIDPFLFRILFCLIVLPFVSRFAHGQLSDPIPAPIVAGPVTVGLELLTTLPDTQADVNDGRNTNTRINFFRETDDGRQFVNDLRGVLYEIDSAGGFTEYANLRDTFTNDIYTGSLASGFTSFGFHPEFSTNGLFYTIHSESASGTPSPDHIPATYNSNDVNFQAVVTEWTATTPSAGTFSGTRRELLRVGMTANNAIHPLGDVSFNPSATVGDPDYGMLYIAGGDWAISTLNDFDALQRLDTLPGTMLRVDPRSPSVTGGIAGIGDYTIPADNPFANDGDPNTFGEIYAYGFRNCHRISWDANGNMYGMDIGQNQIEEINVILPGGNYGWGEREGTFVNGQAVNGDRTVVFAGAPGPDFIDPVAQYDHDEGAAIAGGFAYEGTQVPELQGKFVFGDIVDGRLFYCEVADLLDGDPNTEAQIFELQLQVGGSPTTMQTLIGGGRVDLRLGKTNSGEIVVMSKEDGTVRQFTTLMTPPTDWVLIDDFQGLSQGTLVEGTTGPGATWTGDSTSAATAEPDPDCAANLALLQSGAPGNTRLRAAFTDASTNIAAGATGTLFYRIRVPVAATGTTDHVIGLTDNPDITNFNFKSGLRNTVVAGSGTNTMDARNGGGYENVSALADDTWYKVWMVTNNDSAAGTFELYMQSDTDPNYATQTKLSSAAGDTFDYRINGATAIVNFYLRNAANNGGVAGNDIYIDDIYINPGISDLTDPSGEGLCSVLKGDVNLDGAVTFLDIFPFIGVLSNNAFQAEADCDCDGDVDFLDIQPFIDILAGN